VAGGEHIVALELAVAVRHIRLEVVRLTPTRRRLHPGHTLA
jgi:hypothetical protein